MKSSLYAYFLPLTFVVIWGLSFVWSEQILKVYSPITMITIRLCLASLILFAFVKFAKKLQKLDRKDWGLMVLVALCQPFAYFIGESYGIVYSSASFAAIMIALIPLMVPLAVWLVFGIRSQWTIFLGLVISFGGILYMILGDNFELVVDIRGILFLSMAVLAAVFYALCISKLTERYNNFTIVFYQTALGTLMFLPLFASLGGFQELRSVPFDFTIFRNIMLLAIFGSGVAFICYVESIKQIGAVRAAMFANLIPIVTVIGAFFLLNQVFTVQKLIGMSVVILGLFVAQIKLRKKDHRIS
ncbi:MAG: DMT family transporter [Bacteroidales bacterium]|nr:DMT family transporter [Bacteroidales bacterium]